MLKVGKRLWWLHCNGKDEGSFIISNISVDSFWVWGPKGTQWKFPKSILNQKLFLNPQLTTPVIRKIPAPAQYVDPSYTPSPRGYTPQNEVFIPRSEPLPGGEKACEKCALRKRGECTSLKNEVCVDYQAVQYIPNSELASMPKYCDATAIRKRDRKHFKD